MKRLQLRVVKKDHSGPCACFLTIMLCGLDSSWEFFSSTSTAYPEITHRSVNGCAHVYFIYLFGKHTLINYRVLTFVVRHSLFDIWDPEMV